MKHMGTNTIQTERLTLRKLEYDDGEMIGSIGITIASEYDLKGGLGYKIGSRWWNKGYASEAAKAVMCKEGILRHYYKTRDGFQDCSMYGIIRCEWNQIRE